MILVDSSALIEYYRPTGDASVRGVIANLIASDQVAYNGVIQVEILGHAAGKTELMMLTSDFEAFHRVKVGDTVFRRACELGFELRRNGLTVPTTDLVIAASALEAGVEIYHLDGHFQRIAEHSDLSERHLTDLPRA